MWGKQDCVQFYTSEKPIMCRKNLMVVAGALLAAGVSPVFAIPFDNSTGSAVVATVGTGGDYPDFKAACDAFNAVVGGINRPWTMQILNNLTEPNLVSVANTFGVDGSLTIKPAPSTTPTIDFTYASTAPGGFFGHFVVGSNAIAAVPASDAEIPDTNGKYIIDGSNTNGGTTRDMKFAVGESAAVASPVNRILRIVGRTDGVVVKNLRMVFNDTAGSYPCIGLGAGIVGSTPFAPDNCLIDNCELISGQITGVGASGFGIETSTASNGSLPSGTAIEGLTVQDCDITARQRGIFMSGVGDATIQRNNITITATATSTLTNAIFHLNSNNDLAFTQTYDSNVISVESAINAAGGNGAIGIMMDGGSAGAVGTFNVRNNIVKGAFLTNASAIDCVARGISAASVTSNYNIEHNTVIHAASSASAATAGRVAGISLPLALTTGTAAIRNNIVTTAEVDGTAAAVYLTSATGVTSVGNNLFAAVGGRVGRVGATDHATLASWQGAGFDTGADSQSVDPSTTTPPLDSNQHFAQRPITGLGSVASSTVLTDIDGDARPATNAIPGADEPPTVSAVADWTVLEN